MVVDNPERYWYISVIVKNLALNSSSVVPRPCQMPSVVELSTVIVGLTVDIDVQDLTRRKDWYLCIYLYGLW